jgi:hypothetical protein
MAAKIQIKNDTINSFGGIFFGIDQFRASRLAKLVNNTLGSKGLNARFKFSDTLENMASIFLSGGEVLEDVNFFRQEAFGKNPDYRFCSADTIARDLRGLAVENTQVQAVESGKTYQFNINDKLNSLLLKALLQLGMVNENEPVVFDYDNQFIATEKYDATYSYKKANGYFPGIAQLNLHPFYIENRDGNASVKLDQAETLERAFAQLKANGIKVDKARMDCGSYSQEVVEVVSCNCKTFYIRAMGCQALEKRIAEIKEEEWRKTEINNQECGLTSLPFTAFFAERGYRLVVQRTLVSDKQSTLFDCYVYRCILTNDWESSERKVVEFYNQRGASERTFDMQNNDFGWKHLPFSFMKENTVFMILTALIRNFYVWLVGKIAANKDFGLEATSRVKRFVFRFVQVPFRWVFRSRQWQLQLYTSRPYDKLRL